jgi:photosystem II stability/assembly factor-like uncharacterized protein
MLHRRARWMACASLIVLVALGIAACGSSSPTVVTTPTAPPTTAPTATPSPPSGIVVTAPIVGVIMSSATNGWGMVQSSANPNLTSRIAYTLDGGHTWYDVTPAGLAASSPGSAVVYPLSTTEAWAWEAAPAGGVSTALYHTTDSGAHWSTSTVATGAVKQLDFIDSQHGWLAATPNGGAASHYPINVWSTTDGGASWSEVATSPIFPLLSDRVE